MLLLLLFSLLQAQTVPGTDMVGRGIFLYGYNPFPNSETASTQFGDAVFQLSFNTTVPGSCNGSLLIPFGCAANCDFTTSFSSDLTTTQNLEQIHSSFIQNTGLSAGLDFFVGTASSSLKKMTSVVMEKSSVYNQIAAQLTTWSISCPYFMMELSPGFQRAVSMLPANCRGSNASLCSLIPTTFGHAVGNSFLLGGRYFQEIVQTSEEYSQLTSMDFSLKVAASMAFSSSIGASYSGSVSQSDYQAYVSNSLFDSTENFGGFAPGQNWTAWAPTVLQKPQVLQVHKLTTLDQLLTPMFFPNDPNIAAKQKVLQTALMMDLNASVACPNDCSGNGNCTPSSVMHIGVCQCEPGFLGWDCSQVQTAPIGSWCGIFNASWPDGKPYTYYGGVGCDGLPLGQCPKGWLLQTIFEHVDYKNQQYMLSCLNFAPKNHYLKGSICGADQFLCQNSVVGCPDGFDTYQIAPYIPNVSYGVMCLLRESTPNLTGMLCGDGYNGIGCGSSTWGSCPDGFHLQNDHVGSSIWVGFCVAN